MPSTSWYWDQYQLEKNNSELDITNDSWLQEQNLTRSERSEIETDFIDELYGTSNAQWVYPDPDYKDQVRSGMPEEGDRGPEGTGILGQEGTELWGLDLVRTEDQGGLSYYEHLTKGAVDWAHYQDSNKYKEAFDTFKSDTKDDGRWDWLDEHHTLDDFLHEGRWTSHSERGDQKKEADALKVDFIRAADALGGNEGKKTDDWRDRYEWDRHPDNPKSFWNTWDNKFEPPEVKDLTGWTPSYLDVSGGDVGTIRTDVATKSEFGSLNFTAQDAASEAGIKIRNVDVKAPKNLPKGAEV